MKQFENKLTDNITSAFDAFQEEVDPGAFKDIQSRLSKRRRKVFWLPWMLRGVASMVVAVGGFFIWHVYSGSQTDTQLNADQEMSISKDDHSADHGGGNTQKSPNLSSVTLEKTETHKTSSAIVPEAGKKTFVEKKKSIGDNDDHSSLDLAAQLSQKEQPLPISQAVETNEIVLKAPADPIIPPSAAYQVLQSLPTLTPWVFSGNSVKPMFILESEIDIQKDVTVQKESAFSLVAGVQSGLINYQLARGLGYKVGGRYQIPLNKGLGLTTGLMISYVRMGYDPELGMPLSLDNQEVDLSVDFQPPYEVEVENWVDSKLWSLEIPVQLTYSWRHLHGGLYRIGVGVSSFWQLRHRFEIDQTVYTVEAQDISSQQMMITDIRKETTVEDYPPLQRFDPFAMFNLTFAFPIKLGSRNIYLEPYMQIPIGKQTSRSIRYGSGGIHVIFPFYQTKTISK